MWTCWYTIARYILSNTLWSSDLAGTKRLQKMRANVACAVRKQKNRSHRCTSWSLHDHIWRTNSELYSIWQLKRSPSSSRLQTKQEVSLGFSVLSFVLMLASTFCTWFSCCNSLFGLWWCIWAWSVVLALGSGSLVWKRRLCVCWHRWEFLLILSDVGVSDVGVVIGCSDLHNALNEYAGPC